jgi:hypothetical protein
MWDIKKLYNTKTLLVLMPGSSVCKIKTLPVQITFDLMIMTLVFLPEYYLCDQIMSDAIGRECGMYGGVEKCKQGF